MLKLAGQYLRYYKSQTCAILAGIVLTAALLSGISSLLYSSQRSELENMKTIYGDWHYRISAPPSLFEAVQSQEKAAGYHLVQCGKLEIRDVVNEPYPIYFVYADEAYRQMTHRELLEGSYPKAANEIAADSYTLGNLGVFGGIGASVSIGGKDYILTGIVKSRWASHADEMEIFTGDGFKGQESSRCLYLRFEEPQWMRRTLYKQMDAFLQKYQIPGSAVEANDEVAAYLGGEQPDSLYDIFKFGLTDEEGNITYIILKLQSEYRLAFYGMIFLLGSFGIFVIYSIFNISVSRRVSEYAMLQTIGIREKSIAGTLCLELWMLLFIGYPAGCLLGNGILKACYAQLDGVFAGRASDMAGSGTAVLRAQQAYALEDTADAGFYTAWNVVLAGFIVFFAAFAAIAFYTVYSMRRQSVRQAMSGERSFRRRRTIYSRRRIHLADTTVRKFMFLNKKKAAGILLSLSLGGCIFLCTSYLVENLKIHAQMSMQSDDGLGSQFRISVRSNVPADTIPKATADEIRQMPQLSKVYAVKYTFGEVKILKKELKWNSYFDERNKNRIFLERYGGICVEKPDGTYGIKYNVYGYDSGMLSCLKDFVLEGDVIPEELENGNKIIAAANVDGQGNYDFYGKHPGDTIVLRVPAQLNCAPEVLKFQNPDDDYIEREFEIAAVVSRATAQEDQYLNIDGWSGGPSVILSDSQMSRFFGIRDYSFIHASSADDTDTDTAAGLLLQKIQDVPKAVFKDYTAAIAAQKKYLQRQQLFFSGIAAILLAVSLFHIMNSMHYSILARRREYGILRAMGITDAGFYKMIVKTGLMYGILTDLFLFLIFNLILRRAMLYYMAHIVQFVHFTAEVPKELVWFIMILNVLIAVAAVLIPAGKIVHGDIIGEIQERRSGSDAP